MQIQTHITFVDETEYVKFCAMIAASGLSSSTPVKAETAAPVKEKPVKVVKAAEPEVETIEETTQTDDALTYDQVKALVLKVSKLKGRDAAVRALKTIGADKVGPHIDKADYSKLADACNKELEA